MVSQVAEDVTSLYFSGPSVDIQGRLSKLSGVTYTPG